VLLSTDFTCLTTVPNEFDADMLCSYLIGNGVQAFKKRSDLAAASLTPIGPAGPTEVWVPEPDLAAAQELLKQANET